jgi:hypothetical protein
MYEQAVTVGAALAAINAVRIATEVAPTEEYPDSDDYYLRADGALLPLP